MKLYCYPKCTTCKKSIKFLQDRNLKFEIIDYTINPLTKEQLQTIYKSTKADIKKLFNTSGNVYKNLNLKDTLQNYSEDEKFEMLANNAMLVKRPILISKDKILIGFKEEQWLDL